MDTRNPAFGSIEELRTWCERAPNGTRLEAHEMGRLLASVGVNRQMPDVSPASTPEPLTWRERLWMVPAETRIGVVEVSEALGRPRSWVYARTGPKGAESLPHRKLDGSLVFTAGEIRAWLRAREEVIEAGPMDSTPDERRMRVV